jgi:hypothetical protein
MDFAKLIPVTDPNTHQITGAIFAEPDGTNNFFPSSDGKTRHWAIPCVRRRGALPPAGGRESLAKCREDANSKRCHKPFSIWENRGATFATDSRCG